MLGRQLDRVRRCRTVDAVVVAIPDRPSDDVLAGFVANHHDVICHRGSETDVLARYHGAAVQSDAETIVRITGDCPLIDPAVIDACVAAFHEAKGPVHYLSNTQRRTFARGMDTEVFSREALEEAHRDARSQREREHVTPYIYDHKDRFRLADLLAPRDSSKYRLTVDTPADLELVAAVFEALLPRSSEFTLEEILALLEARPELARINAHVEQKLV
jgi:spore coat polysaccharide biosynthesis protein SpsF